MKRQDFLSNSNLRMLGSPAAAVAVMTLILSRGDFVAAIGAGIGTAVSVYVTNYRLITKTKFLEEKIKDLTNILPTHPNSDSEHLTSLNKDIESLKDILNKEY